MIINNNYNSLSTYLSFVLLSVEISLLRSLVRKELKELNFVRAVKNISLLIILNKCGAQKRVIEESLR